MIFHVDHEQFQINQRYEYQFANDSNYWEAMVRRCGPGTCRLLNALWIYALNTCLVLQSETCWHSRRVLRIGNERRDLFAVSVNQFRRYIYERERERERGRIDNLHIYFPKGNRFLRTPKLVCWYCRIWPRSFLFLLSVEEANASLQRIILYIYVLLNDMYDTNYGV